MNRKLKTEELSRIDVQTFRESKKFDVMIILDNIRSGNNVGSVFRTCDAFRIEKIFLCGITARPPQRDIHKTALGATETVEWEYFESAAEAIEKAAKEGYRVWAVEQTENSLPLNEFIPEKNRKYALVFGNEVRGVDQQVIDRCEGSLEIPQFGTKHSLNIAVSAGIVLWHLFLNVAPFR